MTMLDSMRRHKGWLKWSLGIVGVTFVWFYVPSFFRSGQGTAATDTLATVEGRDVLVGAYQRLYQQQLTSIRASAGANFDEKMLQQFGIPQRIIMQMVDSEAVLAEAARLGITVSDAELAERITRMPGFQENGHFIGETRYRQLLQMQRPPISPSEFEEELREQLTTEKLQAAVTGWIRVSDADVDEEYKRRNEKVKLDLAIFTADDFKKGITPTDAELAAQFNAHPDTYKIPEKRRARVLAIDADALAAKMTVTQAEVEKQYRDNIQTYSTPEQVRASHILLKTKPDGSDDAAVKAKAEAVLKQAKAGADFAELAKKNSEDESNAKNGGDLDYFGRGRMMKEFEDAAFAMQVGQISDLVKTSYGYHIIKLTDKKPAAQRTLAEVRPQIEQQLKYEKAQAEASKIANEVSGDIKAPADLDKVARAHGLTVVDSGLFARDEPLAGIGFAAAVASKAFTMDLNTAAGPIALDRGGSAYIALTEIKPSYVPKLDEVKDKVKEDVIRLKAVELAKSKAATMAQSAKANFAGAAKAAGVTVKSTELITRGSAYPQIGVNAAVDDAVFGLKAGDTTGPISTDNAVVIARVKERQDPDASKASADKEALRSELIQSQRGTFFAAYMQKAKAKMKITFNNNAIKTVLGG